jgi:RNA polymerase sigma-70 factor (ECF subfamily)
LFGVARAEGADNVTSDSTLAVTELLVAWSKGDLEAFDRLVPIIYNELHQQAAHYMRHQGVGCTLQTTALVNEAYLRLAGMEGVAWSGRTHFFAVAAKVMRRILVDQARARASGKRGARARVVSLAAAEGKSSNDSVVDVLALDQVLERLQIVDERKSRIVELRYFSGLSIETTAEVMSLSPATIKREWILARAWLKRELVER